MQTSGRFNQSSAERAATFQPPLRNPSARFCVMNPFPLASMPEMPTSTARSGATAPRFRAITSTTRLHGTVRYLPFDSVIRVGVLCCDVILTKRERDRVHAVAQPSRWRSVIEDMSQMRATARARNFPAEDRGDSIVFVH